MFHKLTSQMIIMNIEELHQKEAPVSAKPLFKGELGTSTSIQLKSHSVLKEHITKTPALLICVIGKVVYHDEKDTSLTLGKGDYVNISPNIKHWLEGIDDSQLLLLK